MLLRSLESKSWVLLGKTGHGSRFTLTMVLEPGFQHRVGGTTGHQWRLPWESPDPPSG
jgi:hypothetical protein